MAVLVADTSGLVSLGIAAGGKPDPLALCLDCYDVLIPATVVDELREVASHDDAHGRAATVVLDRQDRFRVRSVSLDAQFPLDDGENAAVSLANEVDAALFLCDEFNSLGLVHASLADTRLVTTPTLLSVFVRQGRLESAAARAILGTIGDARSWEANSYVERARTLLDGE
jgi:rRNA-processing protein FCF1